MTFTQDDEGTHVPTDDPLWQESITLVWWDDNVGIGGMHRLGQVPNEGTANYWNALMCADGLRYRGEGHDLPLSEEDRGIDFLRSGGQMLRAGGGDKNVLQYDDGATKVDLRFTDFGPMVEVWEHGTGGSVEQEMAANHYETSGKIWGTVRMGDREVEVDGLMHRDHSWGPRDWEALLGHRWVVGTAGPDFCFAAAVMLGTEDIVAGGYVIQDGVRRQAAELDVVVGLECDNVTVRNAVVTWAFADGSATTIECEPMNGVMLAHGPYIEADQFSRFKVRGEDISGWCNVETSINHRLHNRPVTFALGAGLEMGFSQAPPRRDLSKSPAIS